MAYWVFGGFVNRSAKTGLGETGRGTWACSLRRGTPCLVRDLNLGLQAGAKIFRFFIQQLKKPKKKKKKKKKIKKENKKS